jgi:hypothetical protein
MSEVILGAENLPWAVLLRIAKAYLTIKNTKPNIKTNPIKGNPYNKKMSKETAAIKMNGMS